VLRPQSLQAAGDPIRRCREPQGYGITPQHHFATGVHSSNLEITRRGTRHPGEIILPGAHND